MSSRIVEWPLIMKVPSAMSRQSCCTSSSDLPSSSSQYSVRAMYQSALPTSIAMRPSQRGSARSSQEVGGSSTKSVFHAGVNSWTREPVPVSYTHLRAHETVLDLVCRLLLEKKKKNK